jgi:hypothetical protein
MKLLFAALAHSALLTIALFGLASCGDHDCGTLTDSGNHTIRKIVIDESASTTTTPADSISRTRRITVE